MKLQILCFLALLAPLRADNLFSNGTMDTAGGWRGTKKMVEEPENGKPNRYLMLSAKKSDPVSFSQEIDTKDVFGVTVKFRYRTKDYNGLGLELRGIRANDGFTFTNRQLKADGQWHEMTWVFSQVTGSRKTNFSFILLQGVGDVHFDDFSAEASK